MVVVVVLVEEVAVVDVAAGSVVVGPIVEPEPGVLELAVVSSEDPAQAAAPRHRTSTNNLIRFKASKLIS